MTTPETRDLDAGDGDGDGHTIKVFDWSPQDNNPIGVVQILHGLGEHAGRYDRFAQACNANNLAVVAHNHRGHGVTENRGHYADNNGWDKVVGDVLRVRQLLADLYPACPVVLLGHSMGSYIAQSFVMRHGGNNLGLILSGTTFASRIELRAGNLAARALVTLSGGRRINTYLNHAGIGKLNERFRPVRTNADWLSRDENEVDRYIADPLCGGTYSNRLWADLTSGLLEVTSERAITKVRTDLPILILGGEQDPAGGKRGLARLANTYRRTKHEQVHLKIYTGGRHEMLNETNRGEVTADIIDWIRISAIGSEPSSDPNS